MQNLLMVHIS